MCAAIIFTEKYHIFIKICKKSTQNIFPLL